MIGMGMIIAQHVESAFARASFPHATDPADQSGSGSCPFPCSASSSGKSSCAREGSCRRLVSGTISVTSLRVAIRFSQQYPTALAGIVAPPMLADGFHMLPVEFQCHKFTVCQVNAEKLPALSSYAQCCHSERRAKNPRSSALSQTNYRVLRSALRMTSATRGVHILITYPWLALSPT